MPPWRCAWEEESAKARKMLPNATVCSFWTPAAASSCGAQLLGVGWSPGLGEGQRAAMQRKKAKQALIRTPQLQGVWE